MKKYETPKLEIIQFQTEDVALGYSGSLIIEESKPYAGGTIEDP